MSIVSGWYLRRCLALTSKQTTWRKQSSKPFLGMLPHFVFTMDISIPRMIYESFKDKNDHSFEDSGYVNHSVEIRPRRKKNCGLQKPQEKIEYSDPD